MIGIQTLACLFISILLVLLVKGRMAFVFISGMDCFSVIARGFEA